MKPLKVALINNDATLIQLISAAISDHYAVRTFTTAAEFLMILSDYSPDIVLLKVNLPDQSGYEVCRLLRQELNLTQTPILFISADDDLESRLLGYEAGGDDFLVIPLYPEEVLHKVQHAQRLIESRQALLAQLQLASQTAFTAMSNIGELGVILEFSRQALACESPFALASVVMNAVQQYQLEGMVEVRWHHQSHLFCSQGMNDSPLAGAVIGNLRHMGRIFEFKHKLVINYPHITLVIDKLPSEDIERVGRIRDNLALISETTENKLIILELAAMQSEREKQLLQEISALTDMLDKVQYKQKESANMADEIIEQSLLLLEQELILFGLTQNQEKSLTDNIRQTLEQLMQTLQPPVKLQQNMLERLHLLHQLLSKT